MAGILNKNISIIAFIFLIFSCKNDQKESESKTIESNEFKPKENFLLIGDDTLKLKALYDTVTCAMASSQDKTGRFKSTGLTTFVPFKYDTIKLYNYFDYYDDCNYDILDTLTYKIYPCF